MRVGAVTRHRELLESDELAAALPNSGTPSRVSPTRWFEIVAPIGGSLCQARSFRGPVGSLHDADASCVIKGSGGTRVVTMTEFYRGPYETAVADGEMLIESASRCARTAPAPMRRSSAARVTGPWSRAAPQSG